MRRDERKREKERWGEREVEVCFSGGPPELGYVLCGEGEGEREERRKRSPLVTALHLALVYRTKQNAKY